MQLIDRQAQNIQACLLVNSKPKANPMKKIKFRRGQNYPNISTIDRPLEVVSDNTGTPEKSIHQVGAEILSHMLDTVQRNLTDIPFFASKGHDVHPLYKFVFQEIVKRGFEPPDGEDDSRLATIGIEGFDASQL